MSVKRWRYAISVDFEFEDAPDHSISRVAQAVENALTTSEFFNKVIITIKNQNIKKEPTLYSVS